MGVTRTDLIPPAVRSFCSSSSWLWCGSVWSGRSWAECLHPDRATVQHEEVVTLADLIVALIDLLGSVVSILD